MFVPEKSCIKGIILALLAWSLCVASAIAGAGPKRVSFLNDVEPILTRAGCNQGACHGSQFGKGGFKLSLAGYDPEFDHDSIVRQAKGRRISLASPAESLLLRKSTLVVPHSGGLKIARDSDDYRTVVAWLAAGAPGRDLRDPHVTALEPQPGHSTLKSGEQFRVIVHARYSDGTVLDVTNHTRISSLDDRVATVTPEGRGMVHASGATAIMLRFDGLATVSRVVVPYEAAGVEGRKGLRGRKERPSTEPPFRSDGGRSIADRFVAKQWRELGLAPSPQCTDSEFVRRAFLDIIGTLPAPDEVRAFVADRTADKDRRLIDRLLSRPEYADYWALKWGDLLRISRSALGEKGMWSFRNWIHTEFVQNRPFDEFVHALITAQGGAFSTPAANYYRVTTAPNELAEGAAQVFLGIRLQCARCHHHPFEKWSQNDYYQFAAFFARIGVKEHREPGSANAEPSVRVLATGEVVHPKTALRMTPTPLAVSDGPALQAGADDADGLGDRRRFLADWLTNADNRQFAKTVVNRYWGYFLGRGIVNPIDDMRVTNPPSNPELMDALAADFTTHGFDLKRLIRNVCSSKAYRLSSHPTIGNRADSVFYSHFLERRQPAEVLLDSIDIAAGAHEKFDGLPIGTRAIALPDATVASSFLDTFGRPPRSTSCECERTAEPSLSQSLQLLNGDLVNGKVVDRGGRIAGLFATGKTDAQIIDEIYYATVSRSPRDSERAYALRTFSAAATRRQAAEDLLWALINTKEFAWIQ